MIFNHQNDDPRAPTMVMYCITSQDQPIVAKVCRKHGKPHCVYLFDGGFELWLCFRSVADAVMIVSLIDRSQLPPLNLVESRVATFTVSHIIALAESLPHFSAKDAEVMLEHHGGRERVLHFGSLLLMDPQTGIWAPFFFILLGAGVLKVYETHLCDPGFPSGMIYVRAEEGESIYMKLPKVEAPPDLKQVASMWAELGFTITDEIMDYDLCAASAEERDRWMSVLSEHFKCISCIIPVKITANDIIIEDEEPVGGMEEPLGGIEDEVPRRDFDAPIIRPREEKEIETGVNEIWDDVFGYALPSAPVLCGLPAYDCKDSKLLQEYVLLESTDGWMFCIALCSQVEDPRCISIFSSQKPEDCLMKLSLDVEVSIGRQGSKPYCIFSDEWSICFRHPLITLRWANVLIPHKISPGHLNLVNANTVDLSLPPPMSLKVVLEFSEALPIIEREHLPRKLANDFEGNAVELSAVLLYDKDIQHWNPFIFVGFKNSSSAKNLSRLVLYLNLKKPSGGSLISFDEYEMPSVEESSLAYHFPNSDINDREWEKYFFVLKSKGMLYCFCLPTASIKKSWCASLYQIPIQ